MSLMRRNHVERLVVTTKEAAYMLGVSPKTLANWRYTKTCGPSYTYIGKRVVYPVDELREYVREHTVRRPRGDA